MSAPAARSSTAKRRRAARTLAAMISKELRQLVRDRALFGYILYTFTLQIVVAAAGTSTELQQAPVLIRDGDRSAVSRELVARLRPPYFRVAGPAGDAVAAERALDRGEVAMVLEIPPGTSQHVSEARQTVGLQALVDSSKVTTGYLTSSYAARITETLNHDLMTQRLSRLGLDPNRLPLVENQRRALFNFAGNDQWSSGLANLLAMMTVACVLLPGAALVREKEHGTAEQLLVSPLTPLQILLPKILSMALVSLAGTTTTVFLILGPVFGLPCRGSALLFLGITIVYALTVAGLGVLLATFSRTAAQLGLLIILTVIPLVQLSGTWNAIDAMPAVLRYAMTFSPLRHFIVISYGILLKGVGLGVLWREVAAIVALGVVFMGVALARFHRQFEQR